MAKCWHIAADIALQQGVDIVADDTDGTDVVVPVVGDY